MFDNIKVILQRIEDNEYSGENADALRALDIEEARQYLDSIEDKIGSAIAVLELI